MTGNPHSQRIIVLGAGGKLGRMVCHRLQRFHQDHLTVIPVFRTAKPLAHALQWTPKHPVPQGVRADVVVALWGVTSGSGSALMDNVSLAEAAQALAVQVGARRVLHCSSVAVYAPGDPLSELSSLAPLTPYGQAKMAMEQRLATYVDGAGPQPVCLRIGNVAGADSLFNAGYASGQITLDRFADGQGPQRSYIAPLDLTRVLVDLVTVQEKDLPFVLNVAAPGTTHMADLARGMGWPVSWRAAPLGARQVVKVATDRLSTISRLPEASALAAHMVEDLRVNGGPE